MQVLIHIPITLGFAFPDYALWAFRLIIDGFIEQVTVEMAKTVNAVVSW